VVVLTPGHDSLTQLLRLLEDKPHAAMHPFIASVLAEHQRVPDLVATVFTQSEWKKLDELRACLFHELLLRGADTETRGPLRDWTLARPGWHPLAWLSTHRRDFEAGVKVPSRSLRGSAGGVSSQLPTTGLMDTPTPRSSEPSALQDIATADVYGTIVAALQAGDWGACGAWVFRLDQAVTPDQVPALLPTLPMACGDGLDRRIVSRSRSARWRRSGACFSKPLRWEASTARPPRPPTSGVNGLNWPHFSGSRWSHAVVQGTRVPA
jgi:hypothetical protein